MALHDYRCGKCGRELERLEVTSEDKANPPKCCGAAMAKLCGAASFGDLTMRGTWVRFKSNRGPVRKNRGARGI